MASAPASPARSSRWLFGPTRDLLLGCGLWYAVALVWLCAEGTQVRLDTQAMWLPMLTLVFGTPHYGATLLRVYQNRDDRRGYALFAVWATALIALIFALAVYQPIVGSLVLTVYLTWSPWHYTGQNYGLAVMFLRRRGVALPDREKRVLYASFFLSFLLTFLAQHGGSRTGQFVPLHYQGAGYIFLPIGIPTAFTSWAIPLVGTAYLGSLALVFGTWWRRAPVRDWLPAAMLVASQALWFSVPLATRQFGWLQSFEPFGPTYSEYYFFWIAIAHSVQYLWVTSYYARAGSDWSGASPYFLKVMLAGAAAWTVPAFLFAPTLLGRLPFDAGLSVLVASTVNIHHFMLDGAIWKLRDGRVARILLRPRGEAGDVARTQSRRWVAPAVWAAGLASVYVMFGSTFEEQYVLQPALNQQRLSDAEQSVERLSWMGRDSASLRSALAQRLGARGQYAEAERQQRRAIALHPSPAMWSALGALLASQGRHREAIDAYDRAIAMAPDIAILHHRAGEVWMAIGDPERARQEFSRAVELDPDRPMHRLMLERAESALRQHPDSAATDADPPARS